MPFVMSSITIQTVFVLKDTLEILSLNATFSMMSYRKFLSPVCQILAASMPYATKETVRALVNVYRITLEIRMWAASRNVLRTANVLRIVRVYNSNAKIPVRVHVVKIPTVMSIIICLRVAVIMATLAIHMPTAV